METMKMKINPLPSRTWHWTGMNDSELVISPSKEDPMFTLEGQTEGLLWLPDWDPESFQEAGGPDPAAWAQIETGMGTDFAGWMGESRRAYLGIPAGSRQTDPTVLTVDAIKGQSAGQVLIHAGSGCEASLVLALLSNEKDCCTADTVSLQILIQAEADAHVRLYVVQMLPSVAQSCLNLGGVLQDHAGVDLVHLSLGARKSYIGAALELAGEKSTFSGDLGYRVRPKETVDINYVARQEGRDTESRLTAWGVLEEDAEKLFRGTIDFKEGCAGSTGTEKEEVLLLGAHQMNRTIPLILCHEEDVEGNHGATISRLDEQMLFYLGSRGVDPKRAENMIARARLKALISRIPDRKVRQAAEKLTGQEEGADRL